MFEIDWNLDGEVNLIDDLLTLGVLMESEDYEGEEESEDEG